MALKEAVDFAKLLVGADTLQMGLPKPFGVFLVVLIRAAENRTALVFDQFLIDGRLTLIVLNETETIAPFFVVGGLPDSHVDNDCRLAPRCQAADLRYTATVADGLLQPAAACRDLLEEPERVQEIGLPRRVGARHEDALLQPHVDVREVTPVLEPETCNLHGLPRLPVSTRRRTGASEYATRYRGPVQQVPPSPHAPCRNTRCSRTRPQASEPRSMARVRRDADAAGQSCRVAIAA